MRNELKVQIAGGLGNQLFMFYAGLRISQHLKRTPIFEISDLRRIKQLHPGLNLQDLGLLNGFGTEDCQSTFQLGILRVRAINRLILKLEIISGQTFWPREIGYIQLDKIPKSIKKLRGYFQTWRYVECLGALTEVKMAINAKISPWAREMENILESENPLCLNVRRGDYKSDKEIGILDLEYFSEITNLHPFEPIWIFTDSPDEVELEFSRLNRPVQVVRRPINSDPVDLLYLMSKARKLAISNSTFSWWAAMMTERNTIVYAPSKWFRRLSDPLDLIPDSWKRIESRWQNIVS